MSKNRGPLVEVELEVGRIALMHKKDAQALGIPILPPLVPPSKVAARRAANKARRPANDKALRPESNKAPELVPLDWDDFTTIDGIGVASAEVLREHGYLSFNDLRGMIDEELEGLPARVRQAIRRWRDGQ